MAIAKDAQEITAYVLGEANAEESTLIDFQISSDADLRAEVEDLRTISDLISTELKKDEVYTLTRSQRMSILQELNPSPAPGLWQRIELLVLFLVFWAVNLMSPFVALWARTSLRN